MGAYKNFKTAIRKKIGMTGVGEFVDDPVQANSKGNWNSWFGNKKYLAEYTAPNRLESYRELVELMREHGVFDGARRLIDCGCGTGHLLLEIHKAFPDISLCGSDFSEESINVSKRVVSNAQLFVSDLYTEPSDEMKGKFDVAVCSEVLEHLLYPDKAVKNIFKLLGERGKAVLAVPNGRVDTYSGHINFWSPESWKVFLENNIDTEVFAVSTELFNGKRNNLAIIERK